MSEATKPPTAEAILAANVARLRAENGLSQGQLAVMLRHRGIAWNRATVAQVETGRRSVGAVDLLVLAEVFGVALATLYGTDVDEVVVGDAPWPLRWYRAALRGEAGTLPSKLRPLSTEGRAAADAIWGQLDDASASREAFARRWQLSDVAVEDFDRIFAPSGRLEAQAAERLRARTGYPVTPGDVAAAVTALWGEVAEERRNFVGARLRPHSLEDERERRVATVTTTSPRQLQAIRGHVMRQLDVELEVAIRDAFDRTATTTDRPKGRRKRKDRR